MGRVILGALIAAAAMFVVGLIFFATPLRSLGQGNVDNQPAAEVLQSLAQHLPATGTYIVPDTHSSEQTAMYGQGPIATIHYNTGGFAAMDAGSLLLGLLLYLVVALLFGAVLWTLERQIGDFVSRAKIVVVPVVVTAAYVHLKMPVFYHHGWSHYFYFFVADSVTLSVGGLIIARWFLPDRRHAPADAPADV